MGRRGRGSGWSAACYDFAYVPIVYVRTYVRIRVRGKKAEAEREREIDGKILPLGNVMRGEQMRLTRKNSAAYRMVEEARQNRKDEK